MFSNKKTNKKTEMSERRKMVGRVDEWLSGCLGVRVSCRPPYSSSGNGKSADPPMRQGANRIDLK